MDPFLLLADTSACFVFLELVEIVFCLIDVGVRLKRSDWVGCEIEIVCLCAFWLSIRNTGLLCRRERRFKRNKFGVRRLVLSNLRRAVILVSEEIFHFQDSLRYQYLFKYYVLKCQQVLITGTSLATKRVLEGSHFYEIGGGWVIASDPIF